MLIISDYLSNEQTCTYEWMAWAGAKNAKHFTQYWPYLLLSLATASLSYNMANISIQTTCILYMCKYFTNIHIYVHLCNAA